MQALGIALEQGRRRERLLARFPEHERRRKLGLPAPAIGAAVKTAAEAGSMSTALRLSSRTSPGGARLAEIVLDAAARVFLISVDNIRGPKRSTRCVAPRHAVVMILRERGWSLPSIGIALGRDHTTCLALLRDERGRRNDPAWRARFARVTALVEGALSKEDSST